MNALGRDNSKTLKGGGWECACTQACVRVRARALCVIPNDYKTCLALLKVLKCLTGKTN